MPGSWVKSMTSAGADTRWAGLVSNGSAAIRDFANPLVGWLFLLREQQITSSGQFIPIGSDTPRVHPDDKFRPVFVERFA